MKKLFKMLFIFTLIAILLYYANEKYNMVEWVIEMGVASQHDNPEYFTRKVREAMLEGKEHIVLTYVGKANDLEWFTKEAIAMAYEIDDESTSSDFDYLRYNTESIATRIVGLGNILNITYDFTYNETPYETTEVDQKIDSLLHKWKIEKLSDYEKIKKIHDFIVKNASYDTALKNYSAYDNLIEKTSTCQGYMCLAYKMLTEAGIPTRILSGTGGGESHGWNIVSLNGKWYNLDCTWDDPLTWNRQEVLLYDYFLKSEEEFGDHIRDEEYKTEEFCKKYKIAVKSYKK